MDTYTKALALAERVVVLRTELATAESALRALIDPKAARRDRDCPPMGTPAIRAQPTPAPVAQRVRDILRDGKKALAFGELVALVGGRPSAFAARSALKKLRERGEVRFAGGKYSWSAK